MAHNESISFDPTDDRDLIEYLNQPGRNKSATMKMALRFYIQYSKTLTPETLTNQLNSLPVLLDEFKKLREMLKSGQVKLEAKNEDMNLVEDIMNQMDSL